MFIAHELALQVIHTLRPLVQIIAVSDRDLADQIRRAASSVVLNLAEGNHSAKGNRQKHFSLAHGSASEVRSGLRTAIAWGWIAEADRALGELDQLIAILWRLTHPRMRSSAA